MSHFVDPTNTIAQSSRVRLARNYADVPFPSRMSREDCDRVIKRTQDALGGEHYTLKRMSDLGKNARGVLVEEHLISPELATKEGAAVLLNEEKTVSIMVGEEDHLRVQAMLPGLQLEGAMELADKADRQIERAERFAFDKDWGYLTACPTNTGTGMRASVMLHLAGLAMLSQTGQVIHAVSQLGLTVRGLYGEGSEASGHLYQLSNQVTLGRTEEEILKLLSDTAQQVIGRERAAREMLKQQGRAQLEDQLMRSYGIFTNARLMTTKEFMERLSHARLAADLGFVHISPQTLAKLMVEVQPATLERDAGRPLDQMERDELRAEIIRKTLT
jgi:protein arginine kinase